MVAVIGDIHGCYFTLVELFNKIKEDYDDLSVYCVGDLVDRGNFSFEVMEFIIKNNIMFTPGNHDYMFYHFFKYPNSVFARSWSLNGNEITLLSYEGRQDFIFKHIDAIERAPLYFDLQDCFISHAGISNKYLDIISESVNYKNELRDWIYSDYSTERGVLWTRDNLMDIGKLQIVGHTKQTDITYDEDANSVYIDTGACVGNKLSAVIVENSEVIETYEEITHLNDIV